MSTQPVVDEGRALRPRRERKLQTYLQLASGIAHEAADALAGEGHRLRIVRRSLERHREVKLQADARMHRLIADRLRAASSFLVVSEEEGRLSESLPAGGYAWIVDPLDGSLNFARGLPWSCISLGLWWGMTPVLGVIQDVNRPEQFQGIVGTGAWLNGKPIRVREVRDKSLAVLCTGFPVRRDYSTPALRGFIADVQAYQKIRMLGSAGLSLAYVACGRADVYQEEAVGLWDVAAGLAIVRAAGGIAECTWTPGQMTLTVRAGNRFLLQQEW